MAKKKRKGGLFRRIAWGFAALYGAYFVGGSCYSCGDGMLPYDICTGKFNKDRQEAYDQAEREKKGLESILSKDIPGKANLRVNIFVHKDVKLFYDDANNPEDDALWIEKVKSPLEGFKIFENEGFNFSVQHAGLIDFPVEHYARKRKKNPLFVPESYKRRIAEFHYSNVLNKDADITLYFLPPVERGTFGYVNEIGGEYALIFVTNSEKVNKKVVAHEIGHLFSLRHSNSSYFPERLLDPFRIIWKEDDLMIQGIFPESYRLTDSERKIVEQVRQSVLAGTYGQKAYNVPDREGYDNHYL